MRKKERRKCGAEITVSCSTFVLFYFRRGLSYLIGVAAFLLKAQFHVPNEHLFFHKYSCCSWDSLDKLQLIWKSWKSLSCGVVCLSICISCPFLSESPPAMDWRLVSISLSTETPLPCVTSHFYSNDYLGFGLFTFGSPNPHSWEHTLIFLSCQSGLTKRSSGARLSWDLQKQEWIVGPVCNRSYWNGGIRMKVFSKRGHIQSIYVTGDKTAMCLGFLDLVPFSDWKYHSFWTAEQQEIQAKWASIFQILSGQSFWAEKKGTAGKSES